MLASVRYIILYDYQNIGEAPQERLGVYVEVQSDPERVKDVVVYSHDTGYSWTLDIPLSIKIDNNNTVWVGSSNLLPPRNQSIPVGQYTVTYTDLAQRQSEHFFSIDSIENSSNINRSDFTSENIVLFNGSGNMIYFGSDIRFKDMIVAKVDYPDVAYSRMVLINEDQTKAIIEIPNFLTDGE